MGGRKNILNEARDQDEQTEPDTEENQDDTESVSDRDQETSQETKKWTHRAPEGLVEEVDEYMEERNFPSRKFTINFILREHLEERR